MMTEQDRKNYWLDLMDHQAESGLSIAAFCQKHNLSRHQFYYWRKRLDQNNKSTGFIQLTPTERSGSGVKIYFGASPYIEVAPGFDPSTLQKVMKALGGYLCSA